MKSDKISRLVTENINLIYLVMKRFRNRGVDREDLFQIGAVGLTKAAQRFDESKGFAFSTYAVPLIIGKYSAFYVMMEWYISVEKYWMMQEKLQLSEKNTG